jgi:hypothetical protein
MADRSPGPRGSIRGELLGEESKSRDTLQAAADQIEQRCELMWWLV